FNINVFVAVYYYTVEYSLARHPRKDKSSISSQAWRKAKALGGHCECFEKQALRFILINRSHPRKDKNIISSQARRKAKALDGHCECFEKQALNVYHHRPIS
ncbi:hypothetical protein N665_0094s0039, partial [Sinapis alba]